MRYAPALLLLLAAAGCGVETDDRPASFTYIREAILVPSCATAACHSAQNQRAGRSFDDEGAYDELLNAGVVPGDASASPLIFDVLAGDDPEKRMPLDSPLPDADIGLISRWIDMGAEDN
jgi:hypothetical protein